MMASRDDHSQGLHVGSTGTFSVISEDVRRRVYTVSLRDSSGAEVGTCKGSFDDLQEEVVRPEDVLTLYDLGMGSLYICCEKSPTRWHRSRTKRSRAAARCGS